MTLIQAACSPLLFVLLTLCPASAPLEAPPEAPPWQNTTEDLVILPLDQANAIMMAALIKFAGDVLDIPINFDAELVENVGFSFTGKVVMPHAKFQGFFERLLISKEFVYMETGSGSSGSHRVVHLGRARTTGIEAAKFVSLDELPTYADRGILVTTFIPLKNLTARDCLSSLTGLLASGGSSNLEYIRPIETGNSLVISTFAFKLNQIAELVTRMDEAAGPLVTRTSQRFHDLETRIAALEAKVAALSNK
jgi:hypothetical protein